MTDTEGTCYGHVRVDLFNSAFEQIGSPGGISCPGGAWFDARHNLYVADFQAGDIAEYAPGATLPTTLYSQGLTDPINVTTDSRGNVYVADYNGGLVAEYAQGSNRIVHACYPGGGVEGVAYQTTTGAVFVSFYSAMTGYGQIAEYKKGLAGCHETLYSFELIAAGGLQLDAKGDLIAVDQGFPEGPVFGGVYIIPPPYTGGYSEITTATYPINAALSTDDSEIFITDSFTGGVFIDSYPGGTLLGTLGTAEGIMDADGVAVYQHSKT